ncbi:MAG: hypothetical protein EXR77_14515 [Myxococcales bacterium]|nr:hypothetical protein [Myxococcales bacterium]
MASPNLYWCVTVACWLGSIGCGAAPLRPAPIPATADSRCARVAAGFAARVASGQHVEVSVQWTEPAGDLRVGEAELARRLAQGAPGTEVWVLGRGGSGKSHLADAVEARLCRQGLILRVDCERDLAPRMAGVPGHGSALAQVLAERLGLDPSVDPTEGLLAALTGPWTLILDGTDELTAHELVLLLRDLRWLGQGEWVQPNLIRFERPGFDGNEGGPRPRAVVTLPALRCDQADALLARRLPDAGALASARAWLAAHRLDRLRVGGEDCSYVHMATWRDAELIADLAGDAARGARLPGGPLSQADLWQAWVGLRWGPIAGSGEAGLAWVDRIVAASAHGLESPDLAFTIDRCMAAAPLEAAAPTEACAALLASPLVAAARKSGTWSFRHRTLVDVALARWLVTRHTDCRSLATAVAGHASLELMAMVVAQPAGQRCLDRVVQGACEQGLTAAQITGFVDEALPRHPEMVAELRHSAFQTAPGCAREVLEALIGAP